MTYFAPVDSVAYLAAQLAMLVLRAGVSRELPLTPDRVILAPAVTSISVEEATHRLVELPKPLFCLAYPLESVLRVECTPWADARPHEHQWYRLTRTQKEERGGYLWYLNERYGPSSAHPVLAFGRGDETLLIPSNAVEAWNRDYQIKGVNSLGDDVDNLHAANDPSYREAKRRGAHGLLRFSSPVDSEGSVIVMTFPPSPRRSGAVPEPSEDYLLGLAHNYYQLLLLEHRADMLGGENARRPQPGENERQEDRQTMRQLAEQMRRHYATKAMPSLIAAFLNGCGQHSWCRPRK